MTFQIAAEGFTVSVIHDGGVHPDLLDEMGRRCLWLFTSVNATLPESSEVEPDAEG